MNLWNQKIDIEDFICPVTQSLFFDPVIACNTAATCGHSFEKRACVGKLQQCPCCRADITLFAPALYAKNTLDRILLDHPESWGEVYFNLDHFTEVFTQENGLKTPTGLRFITLLENASKHLNQKPVTRTESADGTVTESVGKSAIEILSSTLQGRDLLRKKLHIDASGKFFFGQAEISAESLQIPINGKSIREWLSMTTVMEVVLEEEQKARQELGTESQTITRNLYSDFRRVLYLQGLFKTAANHRVFSETVNLILQKVVYGNEADVRAALESVRSDSAQLAHALSDTGTVRDYSDRIITGMTLLQAAAAAGDIEMCLMLKDYLSPDEFAAQLSEIFPDGIEANDAMLQENSKRDFEPILQAVKQAILAECNPDPSNRNPDDPNNNLNVALKNQDNGSALCLALEEFRRQFSAISNNEKIFNPQHLLRAFEVYNTLWDECEHNSNDRDYRKRNLFLRQIIGFCQRFVPACYAQAFSQGLYYLVKMCERDSWHSETFKRNLKLKCDNFSYFPILLDSRSGLGFDFSIYVGAASVSDAKEREVGCHNFLKIFIKQKQQAFRTLCSENNACLRR